MKKSLLVIFIFAVFVQVLYSQKSYMEQWPSFRGPFANGINDSRETVSKWDLSTNQNIKWKTTIPGLGHSCPVIWDDFLFITTAVSSSGKDSLKIGYYGDVDEVGDLSVHEFKIYCLNKKSGKIMWEKLSYKGVPKTDRHTKASFANCTPATDGKHVIAFYGSEGMYCYNMSGKLLWKKDFEVMNAGPYNAPEYEWGFASSPIIYEDVVVVQCDFLGDSYLAAFNVKNGNELWRTFRDEISTWSTPTFYSKEGNSQIIVNGYKHMGGYDFKTGKEIWKMNGGGDAPTPTPVVVNGLIFINNAHGRYSPIYAVSPDAKGDITLGEKETENEYIKWSIKRGGAYMQTPMIYGDYLYNMRGKGTLSCFHATTGELMYKEKIDIKGVITASGVAAKGKLYFSTEEGQILVVQVGKKFKLLAKNDMQDYCMATPAISDGVIFFRTQHYVIAVGE